MPHLFVEDHGIEGIAAAYTRVTIVEKLVFLANVCHRLGENQRPHQEEALLVPSLVTLEESYNLLDQKWRQHIVKDTNASYDEGDSILALEGLHGCPHEVLIFLGAVVFLHQLQLGLEFVGLAEVTEVRRRHLLRLG